MTVWLTKGFKDVLGTENDELRNNTYFKIKFVTTSVLNLTELKQL